MFGKSSKKIVHEIGSDHHRELKKIEDGHHKDGGHIRTHHRSHV